MKLGNLRNGLTFKIVVIKHRNLIFTKAEVRLVHSFPDIGLAIPSPEAHAASLNPFHGKYGCTLTELTRFHELVYLINLLRVAFLAIKKSSRSRQTKHFDH